MVLERPIGGHLKNVGSAEVNRVEGYVDNAARTCACFADAFLSKTIRGVCVFCVSVDSVVPVAMVDVIAKLRGG